MSYSVYKHHIAICAALTYKGPKGYRVRARDARIRVMRRTTLTSTCKNEAVEPRTIVNIVRFFGRVMY
jgi:hypothetical protein